MQLGPYAHETRSRDASFDSAYARARRMRLTREVADARARNPYGGIRRTALYVCPFRFLQQRHRPGKKVERTPLRSPLPKRTVVPHVPSAGGASGRKGRLADERGGGMRGYSVKRPKTDT
jgi:hypothetical protein